MNIYRNTVSMSNCSNLVSDPLVYIYACWVVFHVFVDVCRLFSKLILLKNSFRNTISVSNSLDPDQDQQNVGTDLSSNCFQRVSTDVKICGYRNKLTLSFYLNSLLDALHILTFHTNLLSHDISTQTHSWSVPQTPHF